MSILTRAVDTVTKWRRIADPDTPGRGQIWGSFLNAVHAGNPDAVTSDTALNFSAVFAAVNLISDSIKTLPFGAYKRLANGGRQLLDEHPTHRLLHVAPNENSKPGTFKKYLQSCVLLWGNGYAEIDYGGLSAQPGADVKNLWPIHPSRVSVDYTDNLRIEYTVENGDGTQTKFPAWRMFHLFDLTLDGICGCSRIEFARNSIAMGIAAERHGTQFYGNNAQPGAAIVHPGTLSEEAKTRLRKGWQEAYGGGGGRYGTIVLSEGIDIKTIGMPHQDAQFLETRTFQIDEVARWFKVPPHKIAELSKATFSNIEHQGIEYVTDTVLPITIEWEEESNRKLFSESEQTNHFVKANVNGLMRGDSKTRSEYYRTMQQNGNMTINEVRTLEDLNPIGPEGDQHFVPLNMTTAEAALEDATTEPEPPAPPPILPPQPQPPDDEETEQPEQDEQPDEQMQRAWLESATTAANRAIARLRRKEIKAARAAARRYLDKGDKRAFADWIETWYAKHRSQMHSECGPSLALMYELSGDSRDEATARAAQDCKSLASKSQGQLAGILENAENGTANDAIVARLNLWDVEVMELV